MSHKYDPSCYCSDCCAYERRNKIVEDPEIAKYIRRRQIYFRVLNNPELENPLVEPVD